MTGHRVVRRTSGRINCISSLVICLASIAISHNLMAQCTNPGTEGLGGAAYSYWAPGTKITVYYDSTFTPSQIADIKAAVTAWASTPGLSGNAITLAAPVLETPPPNTPNVISIVSNPSASPNTFTYTSVLPFNNSAGLGTNQLGTATVSLNMGYKLGGTTLAYNPNGVGADVFFTSIMEHELGHVFGLTEPSGTTDSTDWCSYTAAPSIMNGYCGQNDQGSGPSPGGILPATITQCDKNIQSKSEASGKANGPTAGGKTGGGSGGGIGGSGSCGPTGAPPYIPPDTGAEYVWSITYCAWELESCAEAGCASPIIIDTDGSGFNLTSASNGVSFDFYGNGQPVQIAWTAPGSTNGWLALDRNGNGLIDSAQELFGNITAQPSSNSPNGFLALAVFDQPENGGNGDGIIDSQDAIWSQLLVWIDANHDGISQPNELHHLADLGIHSIDLRYVTSWRQDVYGNKFRFRGRLNRNWGDGVNRVIYDVFLTQ